MRSSVVGVRPAAAAVAAVLVVGAVQSIGAPAATAADWVQPGQTTRVLGGGWGVGGPATEVLLPDLPSAATDTRNGDVVVGIDTQVLRLPAGGTTLQPVATTTQQPYTAAVGLDGTIYLSDQYGVYRVQGGTTVRIAGNGAAISGCKGTNTPDVSSFPVGGRVTVDRSTGVLYAYSGSCVWRIEGSTVTAIPKPTQSTQLVALAADAGQLWAVDGRYLMRYASGTWTFDNEPTAFDANGIAFGPGHRLYYSNTHHVYVRSTPTAPSVELADTACALVGSIDDDQRGLLSCPTTGPDALSYLQRFDAAGDLETILGTDTERPSPDGVAAADAHLGTLDGLATSPATGSLWFTAQGVVRRVGADGRLVTVSADPRFVTPGRIAFATDGTAYVADAEADRVWVVTEAGDVTPLATGIALTAPRAVAVDADGAVLVGDGERVLRVSAGSSTVVAGGGATPGAGSPSSASATSLDLGAVRDLAVASDGRLAVLATTAWEVAGGTATRIAMTQSAGVLKALAPWSGGGWFSGWQVHHVGGRVDVVTALNEYQGPSGQVAVTGAGQVLVPTAAGNSMGTNSMVLRVDDPALVAVTAVAVAPTVVVHPGWVELAPSLPYDTVEGISASPPTSCDLPGAGPALDPETREPLVPGRTYWAFRCATGGASVSPHAFVAASSAAAATPFVAILDDEAPDPVGGLTVFEGRDTVSLRIADRPQPPDWDRVEIRLWDQSGFPSTPTSGTHVETPSPGQYTSVSDLVPGVSYGISVFNLDESGNYAAPATIRIQLDRTAPGPVTNLTSVPSYLQADLSWTAPVDPDFSEVLVRYAPGTVPPATPTDGTDALPGTTSARLHALTMDTDYAVSLWTVDRAGNVSATPQTLTFRTLLDTEPPPAPTLTFGSVTDHRVTLTSTPASPKPADYGTTFVVVGEGDAIPGPAAPYQSLETLRSDTRYTAVAYTRDLNGNTSAASAPVRFRTAVDVTAPRAPNVSAYNSSSRKITMILTAATYPSVNFRDAASFRVAVREGSVGASAPAAGDETLPVDADWSVTHSVVVPVNGEYTVTVWTVDEVGHRSPGTSRTVTTVMRDSEIAGGVRNVAVAVLSQERLLHVSWEPPTTGAPATNVRLVAVDDRGVRGPAVDLPISVTAATVVAPSSRPTFVWVSTSNFAGDGTYVQSAVVDPVDDVAPLPLTGATVTFTGTTAHVRWPTTGPTDIESVRVARSDGTNPARPGRVVTVDARSFGVQDAGLGLERHAWTLTAIDVDGRESTPVTVSSSLLTTTFVAPPKARYGKAATVSGRVAVVGPGSAAGRVVTVWQRTASGWKAAATATTSSSGAWSARLSMAGGHALRAEVRSAGSAMGSTTASRTITLTPGAIATIARDMSVVGGKVWIRGTAQPVTKVKGLELQVKRHGPWTTSAPISLKANGTFRVLAPTLQRGHVKLRVAGKGFTSNVLKLDVA